MARIPVSSSNIVSIGYDPETRDLEVEFKGGSAYRHAEVPQEIYDGFMAADSKGGFYHANIKGKFGHKKL
jgi:hypothetical protein